MIHSLKAVAWAVVLIALSACAPKQYNPSAGRYDTGNYLMLSEAFTAINEGKAKELAKLLDRGISPTAPLTSPLMTPLFCAITAEVPSQEIIDLLIERGADIQTAPVVYHAVSNNSPFTEYLLQRGANPNSTYLSQHPLFAALNQERNDLLKVLLEYGATPNYRGADGKGLPPMQYAISEGNTNATLILLESGADINDVIGNSYLHYVRSPNHKFSRSDRELLEKAFIEKGLVDDEPTLSRAARLSDLKLARSALAAGDSPNGTDSKHGWRPLQAAILASDLEMVKLLIEAGASTTQYNAAYDNTIDYLEWATYQDGPQADAIINYLLEQAL